MSKDITIKIGDTHSILLGVVDENGNPRNLTGHSGFLSFILNNKEILRVTGSIPNPEDGVIVFNVTHTESLTLEGGYYNVEARIYNADKSFVKTFDYTSEVENVLNAIP